MRIINDTEQYLVMTYDHKPKDKTKSVDEDLKQDWAQVEILFSKDDVFDVPDDWDGKFRIGDCNSI